YSFLLYFSFLFTCPATHEIYTLSYTTLFRSAFVDQGPGALNLSKERIRDDPGFAFPTGHTAYVRGIATQSLRYTLIDTTRKRGQRGQALQIAITISVADARHRVHLD